MATNDKYLHGGPDARPTSIQLAVAVVFAVRRVRRLKFEWMNE